MESKLLNIISYALVLVPFLSLNAAYQQPYYQQNYYPQAQYPQCYQQNVQFQHQLQPLQATPDTSNDEEIARALAASEGQGNFSQHAPQHQLVNHLNQFYGQQWQYNQQMPGYYQDNNYIQLPVSLMNLPNAHVFHPRVTQQHGLQCGPWALANACAIQDIVKSNGAIALTPENIRRYAHVGQGQNVDDYALHEMAGARNLEMAFIVGNNRVQRPFGYTFLKAGALCPVTTINQIQGIWRRNKKLALHFIYNYGNHNGGHYVTISIIKDGNLPPSIIYMDSCNSQLTDNCSTVQLILFLYQQLIIS